ncbi:hypothetical protein B0E53_01816 [Micromonospora sp. MH33]|uniref:helix-turn-helix domain-containing protein n=1 Tax=Micromonospora sp. MH33 TaxID=1945509 RepID=UPI000D149569|nr:helix-turn-helix transcriptional regulator [Micromonospora sp. MH33]PSK66210.1 hypothetical protein B0E53_01816 [Micromonospora sp. MH33]
MADQHDAGEAWRALGQQLAALRKAAGHTQHSLAPRVLSGRSTIANTEIGRQRPGRTFWERCDVVLCANGALVAAYERTVAMQQRYQRERSSAAFAASVLAEVSTATVSGTQANPDGETVMVTAVVGRRDVQIPVSRRALLQAASSGLVSSLTSESATARAKNVDPALVDHFTALRSVLVESDNRIGAAAILPTARQQLGHIADYRRAARGDLRNALLCTEARWAEFAGWLSDDLGDRDRGDWWLAQALVMAQEAGDAEFTAYVFARMAQRAVDAADQDRVLGLAHAAERASSIRSQVRAFAAVQRAHGHAVDGDSAAFQAAIEDAQRLANSADAGNGGLGSFCTSPYVSAQEGDGWLRLGRPQAAARCFDQALTEWPESYRRERGRYLARAAAAHIATGEPQQAALAALAALELARLTSSARIQREVIAVDRQLAKFPTEPGAKQLHDALTAS